MSDTWYYAQGDKAVGPSTLADLKKQLPLVSNAKDVLVWRAGFANWQSAASVSDLALLPAPKPPPIPRSAAGTIAGGLLRLLVNPLAGAAMYFLLATFMPQTLKAWREKTGMFWILFASSFIIAEITVNILARLLSFAIDWQDFYLIRRPQLHSIAPWSVAALQRLYICEF
jgi:hypothetical protein